MRFGSQTLDQWVRSLAGPQPTPAGGALALATLAGAAALAAKVARKSGADAVLFEELAPWFLAAAEQDAAAYADTLGGTAGQLRASLEGTLEHLRRALSLLDGLAEVLERSREPLTADVAASERLARAAARTLLVNLAVNLSQWQERVGGAQDLVAAAAALRARLEGV